MALGLASCLLPCALAQHSNPSPDTPTVAEQYLLAAANQERAARNLPLLRRDPLLARAPPSKPRRWPRTDPSPTSFPASRNSPVAPPGINFCAHC